VSQEVTPAAAGGAPAGPQAQGGATTHGAGDPPPSATPLSQTPVRAAPPSSWRRPLLIAFLVLLAGAALGAAAFTAEQHAFVWEPSVNSTPDGGWRITGSEGLRPVSPVLTGERLIWGQGPYTCVLELASGDTHVVGAAARGGSVWPPAAGPRYVAWIEVDREAVGEGVLWLYDVESGQRRHFAVGREAATPAVAGEAVAWYDEDADGTPLVETLVMDTGRREILARGADIQYPVLGGDGVVGWVTRAGAEGGAPRVVVHDLATGTVTTVPLAGDGSGLSVGDLQLAGKVLLWSLTSAATTRVVAYDVDTHATTVIASGVVSAPATDGEFVVWASGGDTSGACVVLGRRLDDADASEDGRPAAWPSSMAVGPNWVAWVVDEGREAHLEAVRSGL
jgi:hypothetical protein